MTPSEVLSHVTARLDELVEAVRRRGDAASGATGLLVSLSGGPDSVALLLLAHAWAGGARPLEAAHLNHRLRGEDADADEAFCRELCDRLAVPLHVRRADPRPLARARGRGLEEAGRRLRRALLFDLLTGRPHLACAATGHHRDDQVETVLMRLLRGTGLDGLAGIRAVDGRIVHPLLYLDRREILGYLESVGQPYRIDASNDRGEMTRNRVRRELLPLAEDIFGPGAGRAAARLARLVAGDANLLAELTAGTLKRLLRPLPAAAAGPAVAGGGAADEDEEPPAGLDVDGLLGVDPALARRVVKAFLCRDRDLCEQVEERHVEGALAWLGRSRSGQSLDLPGGWVLLREFELVRLLPPQDLPLAATAGAFRIRVAPARPEEDGEAVDGAERRREAAAPSRRLTCPADALRGNLRLRPWREGDRIPLAGLGGRKKVSDLLQERRIGISARPGILVVEDDEGILWVVGVARAGRTCVLPSTKRTVNIDIVPRDPDRDGTGGSAPPS